MSGNKPMDIPMSVGTNNVGKVVSEETIITHKEDNAIESAKESNNKKEPSFGLTKLGEYSVGLVGKVGEIMPILRKHGGYKSSKRMEYEGVSYNGGYIIPYYNLERFLQSLKSEGWNIAKLAKEVGFIWLI